LAASLSIKRKNETGLADVLKRADMQAESEITFVTMLLKTVD